MTEETNLPKTQRAWLVVRKGHPSKALEFKQDAPVPSTLDSGQVLVKIQAAALNPVGHKLMGLLPNFLAKRPLVAEHDFAGTVVAEKETAFKKGDEVFGWIPVAENQKTKQGALSEYAYVDANNVISRPPNVSAVDASGLALAGQTAYMGLLGAAEIKEGQRVFVNGGSSAVGGFAIQIAKAKGCTVVASCSGKNVDYAKSLGADEVIDYTTSPLHSQLTEKYANDKKFHVIYDTVGLLNPNLYSHSDKYLDRDGIFVSVGPSLTMPGESFFLQGLRTTWSSFLRPSFLGGAKAKFKIILVVPKRENLEDLQKLVADGKVKPLVDSTYKFDDVQSAYTRILSGRAKGKVVVKVIDYDT